MKINTALNTFETNAEATSHEFSIGDHAVIIDILRNRLYSNPIQTLVQEYISNARDACREASLEERIVVTLPSESSKTFKVRDYGVGLSPDRVASVFVRYASSTKRDNNNQIGGFGIGAKSAWAYTDNFTVTSYHNGTARHYIAHLGKTNAGSLDLLSETATTEPNGVEVQIAVAERDISAFHDAVFRCTFFWTKKPELRGIAPSNLPDYYRFPKVKNVVENVAFYESVNIPHSLQGNNYTLCIDGIPYGVTYRFSEQYQDSILDTSNHIVLHIPTGKVEVSASREALSDGNKNKTYIKALFDETDALLKQHAVDKLAACTTLGQYIKILGSFEPFFTLGALPAYSDKYKVLGDRLYVDDTLFHNGTSITNDKYVLEKTRQGDAFRLEKSDKPQWSSLWNYTLFVDDGEYSGKPICNAKVRKHLLTLPATSFRAAVVFSSVDKQSLAAFATDVEAIPLSSIDLDKPAKKSVDASVPVKNEVVVTVYTDRPRYHRCGHDTRTVDLDANAIQYVYAVKEAPDAFTGQKHSMGSVATFVQEYTGRKFCFVAAGNVKKLNASFVSVEQVQADPLAFLTDEAKEKFEAHAVSVALSDTKNLAVKIAECKEFMQQKNAVKDANLLNLLSVANRLSTYRQLNRIDSYTQHVVNAFTQANPHVLSIVQDWSTRLASLDAYPLLTELFDSYPSKDAAFYAEAIFYINAKHASKGIK